MKNASKKPGLEFAFYMGLLLLIVLPAMVFAQQDWHATTTIIIKNGDTLLNGKKINQLNVFEKNMLHRALADTGSHNKPVFAGPLHPRSRLMPNRLGDSLSKRPGFFNLDTTGGTRVRVYSDNQHRPYPAPDHMPTMRPHMEQYRMPNAGSRLNRERLPNFGAMQDFDFNSIDDNGIATRLNFHISAALPAEVKRLTGMDKADLPLADLVFIPEFSTGKTLLMVTLPSAGNAEVSFTNTDGKVLWAGKTTTDKYKFTKIFSMPLNGVYYLIVKQGGKTAVRRVVKE